MNYNGLDYEDFQETIRWGEEVEVSDDNIIWNTKRYFIGINPIDNRNVTADSAGLTTSWKYIRKLQPVELTMQQIADKFGISVNQLKIKK